MRLRIGTAVPALAGVVRIGRGLAGAAMVSTTAACRGPQSALDPAGAGAAEIAQLFWWMTGGALLVWVAMIATTLYCARGPRIADGQRAGPWLIVGAGVVLPSVVLLTLLAAGLPSLNRLIAAPQPGQLTIAVAGEQWWWRVRYPLPEGGHVELANEIRLPAGARVDVTLSSDNVIHAFWIPAIAGKVDMIPGRTTRLRLEPTRTGTFRGVCAEYCGTAHALMAFPVVVMERDAFDAWLAAQARPAPEPVAAEAQRGRGLFLAHGCGACHAVRGTPASGVVGPDLTHVGGRVSLAAGTLPNDTARMVAWLRSPELAKPGAHMPAFGVAGDDALAAIAAYLAELR
jgi:cytochrome c oxidase subunit II